MPRTTLGLAALLLLLASAASRAQVPVGAEFQVNTYTTSSQYRPSVAVAPDGGFVIVWESLGSAEGDTAYTSVHARRYSSDGEPLGDQVQVNTYTTGSQGEAEVALAADGGFVVVWQSAGSDTGDTSGSSVLGRRFDATGAPLGGPFQVNSYTTGDQGQPSVAVDPDDGFVVVWASDGSADGDTSGESIHGRRYDSAGDELGDSFQVNAYTTGTQDDPSVAVDADGDFVVVWGSDGSPGDDTSGQSIQARRFAADGDPLDDQLQVNTYTPGDQVRPAVGVGPDGGFVVAWDAFDFETGSDTSARSIQAQRFSSNGDPLGGPFQVNTYTINTQMEPAVAVGPAGDFVVVWQSFGADGDDSSYSVQTQRFDPAGAPLGDQLQVNGFTLSMQRRASLAAEPSGDFVVVWESYGSNDGDLDPFSIQGRRFRVTGDVGDRVWEDEDGDGVQEAGEPGVPGVAVELYDDVGDLVGSTATDADGEYLFAKVADGDHTLVFALPDGFAGFTVRDAGADGVDSDVDSGGETATFTVAAGVTDLDLDAGVVAVLVGDRVWLDANGNGVQNGGEVGVAGVTVRLYREPDPPFLTTLTNKAATLAGIAVTDADGYYRFAPEAGTHYLEFDCSSESFTALDQGASDGLDSDVEPALGTTSPFVLDDGDADPTRDAGLLDPDADGVACSDNCPAVANADQADADGDGAGDACDPCLGDDTSGDADSDGVCADLDCDDGDPGNVCAVFGDGFESGDASVWSSSVP